MSDSVPQWAMEKWQAVALAVVLFIAVSFIPLQFVLVLVLMTALWASFDAGKIGAKQYKSKFMSANPALVFVGCLLLWIVVFPWYLYFRSHIVAGLAVKA